MPSIQNRQGIINFKLLIQKHFNPNTNLTFVTKLFLAKISFKGLAPSKWNGCEDDFAHLVWPSRETFSYKEVK